MKFGVSIKLFGIKKKMETLWDFSEFWKEN